MSVENEGRTTRTCLEQRNVGTCACERAFKVDGDNTFVHETVLYVVHSMRGVRNGVTEDGSILLYRLACAEPWQQVSCWSCRSCRSGCKDGSKARAQELAVIMSTPIAVRSLVPVAVGNDVRAEGKVLW